MSRMALMMTIIVLTLMEMPIPSNTAASTMDRPVMLPTMILLGTRK